MFEAFFTDSCLRYRIEVINGIDFYGLGFGMVRGESMGKWISQWMQKGETASVLITNTKLPDTSGFEFAERIRSQCPRVRVIFVTDTPSFAEAQQAVRFGAYAYLLKSDGRGLFPQHPGDGAQRRELIRARRQTVDAGTRAAPVS